ncbi:subtilisin-like protease SBT1.8 [Bidens hawaiensis]|uniref:subtilisin-like protease SBT1.8 n=1 Tax=Bidens hawaiensis TaxID=980011 RepID=UPI00404B571D
MASVLWALLLCFLFPVHPSTAEKRTYIVQMNHHQKPTSYLTHHDWYADSLQSLASTTPDAILYSYTNAYHGFSASLDLDQVQALRHSDSVLGVYEDTVYQLHTTRTPEFLGIQNELGLWSPQQLNAASHDVIIGVLDTGVWPESKSFGDSSMPDVPARWRGVCEEGEDFKPTVCNKKLIGARKFSKGFRLAAGVISKEKDSPRDQDGHGTHTSTTAAGGQVGNASLFGFASGTARGMAVHARIATYKVCWKTGCFGSDILAGMDQAISDGVDVLSMSLGGGSAPYYRDTIAIGAFKATEMGVFVSCSAGNSGPSKASLANVAPWIMTVGAGTLDRDFPAYAILENGKRATGVSLYSGNGMGDKPVEVVYFNGKGSNSSSNLCLSGSLQPEAVRGKVVFCDRGVNPRVEKGQVVKEAGGVGMILGNTAESGEELVADSHLLPAVAVGRKIGDQIREYLKTEAKPMALLKFGGTVLGVKPSPVVAAFSSRGPNMVTPQILKPDVIGPGMNILAGWSEGIGPTGLESDTRKTQFNIMSGTSMSCPHISGLAALLKAAHPGWSPSAIKSALMTTAYTLDNTKSPLRDAAGGQLSTPWAHGAGHVDPHKAISPGLVYDITTDEYIAFVCSLGYNIKQVQSVVNRPNMTSCAKRLGDPGRLNYPSFSVLFGKSRVVRYTRQLTNVGAAGSVYSVEAEAPKGVQVSVKPKQLVFKNVGDKMRYTVTFVSQKGLGGREDAFGSITWKNAENQVRSPVAFGWERFA